MHSELCAYIGRARYCAIKMELSLPEPLYLDHAATTPVSPWAITAMAEALGSWANPSSPHRQGRAARAALEDARKRICRALGWNGALIFTSGASEALSIALTRAKATHTFVSAVEHDAVLRITNSTARIPVSRAGIVQVDSFEAGDLVVVQSANNETGVLQPLDELVGAIRDRGALLLADCAQTAGKMPLPDADLIAVSAHKFGGPPGIGALLVRDLGMLHASGGQEQGYRGGTENLPAVMGFAATLEAEMDWQHVPVLRRSLEERLVDAGAEVIAAGSPRIATIGAYRMPGVAANAQLIQFDLAGIAVSAGSACSSGSMKPSHVLTAMALDAATTRETIRVSFGTQTRMEDIDRFVAEWLRIAKRAQARAA
jgi:cysteine desulfurase